MMPKKKKPPETEHVSADEALEQGRAALESASKKEAKYARLLRELQAAAEDNGIVAAMLRIEGR